MDFKYHYIIHVAILLSYRHYEYTYYICCSRNKACSLTWNLTLQKLKKRVFSSIKKHFFGLKQAKSSLQ